MATELILGRFKFRSHGHLRQAPCTVNLDQRSVEPSPLAEPGPCHGFDLQLSQRTCITHFTRHRDYHRLPQNDTFHGLALIAYQQANKISMHIYPWDATRYASTLHLPVENALRNPTCSNDKSIFSLFSRKTITKGIQQQLNFLEYTIVNIGTFEASS